MKSLCLLGLFCLLRAAMCQDKPGLCALPDLIPTGEVDFPDIEKLGIESYQMTVEYTLKGAKQTGYYVEYYDSVMRMGRVEGHQNGKNNLYIYRAETWEAWNIQDRKCQLNNITDTPEYMKDAMSDWQYDPPDAPERRTRGPSSMFKMAYDKWQNNKNERTMAYLGEMTHTHIRGLNAQGWRWCQTATTSVDFFFTADDTDDAYDVKKMPLRVAYNDMNEAEIKLAVEYFDILNFQPFISVGLHPFEIPRGLGCGRGDLPDLPKLPDFSKNMLFYAEVVYRKVRADTQFDLASYYSNLMFALDLTNNNVAYYYTPWNTTKTKGDDGKEKVVTIMDAPEFIIYDFTLGYSYKINYENAKCEIGRTLSFVPGYKLPENGGYLDLTNPYVFFPNNEFYYLTKSFDRGLEIETYEAVVENYVMSKDTLIPKVIATHSYLTGDEKTDNVVSVKRAPIQAEFRLFRDKEMEEILTLNFFGFTTKLFNQRQLFDVRRCFPNDDDYSWVTVGFETAGGSVSSVSDMDPTDVEYEMNRWLVEELNFNPIRVPQMLVDIQDDLTVTMLILEKPPLKLDFTVTEDGQRVDTEGMGLMDFDKCATECLNNENEKCWGFSLCGAVCYIGGQSQKKVVSDKSCTLYRRYTNGTYMRSKKVLIAAMTAQVDDGKTISVYVKDNEVKLKAVSILVTDPAEDDPTFERMGNKYSNRMRVLKVGKKLKKGKELGKLRFEECQRLCLDYQDCETISYCLIDSRCVITTSGGEDIKDDDMETDQLCQVVTRKYADNFEVNPGFFLEVDAKSTVKVKDAEACARACMKENGFRCLSFDLCGETDGLSCKLHTTHFLNKDTRKESLKSKATCRHYTRKYSIEFKKHIDSKVKYDKMTPLTNLDVEECAKNCVEYGEGACYAFDYCRGTKGASDSSCIIIDRDPSQLESVYSSVCTHYLRGEDAYAPRPYTNTYAGGIGFLCFLIGGLVGAVVIFTIAYIRVNKR